MELNSEELIRAVVKWLADRRRIIIDSDEYERVAEEVLGYREPTAEWHDAVYRALEPLLQSVYSDYCEVCLYVAWPREFGEIPRDVLDVIEIIYDTYYKHCAPDVCGNAIDDIAARLIYRRLPHPFDQSEPLAWMLIKLAERYNAIDEVVELGSAKYYRIGNTWISYTAAYKNPPGFWYDVYEFSGPPK